MTRPEVDARCESCDHKVTGVVPGTGCHSAGCLQAPYPEQPGLYRNIYAVEICPKEMIAAGVAVNEDDGKRGNEMAVELHEISQENQMAAMFLPLAKIRQSGYNPRSTFDPTELKDLSESIKIHGVLQPIVVRPLSDGNYEIVCGERRVRASKLAKLTHIPAVVREFDDLVAREAAIIENLKRVDINPMDQARGYKELIDITKQMHPDRTQAEIAKQLNIKTASTLSNSIRLLDLPVEIQTLIAEKQLSQTHGRALLSYNEYPQLQSALLKLALKGVPTKAIEEFSERSLGWSDFQVVRPYVKQMGCYDQKFDKASCAECSERRKDYCLKPDCWADKNKQALEVAKAALQKKLAETGESAPFELKNIDRKLFDFLDEDLEGCKADCEHKRIGDWYGDARLVCMNPACHEKLEKAAEDKEEAENNRIADNKLVAAFKEMEAAQMSQECLSKIAAALLAKSFEGQDAKIVTAAAEHLGLKINVKTLLKYNNQLEKMDLLVAIPYETLLIFAFEVILRNDAAHKRRGWGDLLVTNWFLGVDDEAVAEEITEETNQYRAGTMIIRKDRTPDRVYFIIGPAEESGSLDIGEAPDQPMLSLPIAVIREQFEIVEAKPYADEPGEDIPLISATIRVGDWIVEKYVQREDKELWGKFDNRLEAATKKVNHVNAAGDVTLQGGGLILAEELNSRYRYYMRPSMIRIGDHIAAIRTNGISTYEVINKTKNEVRLKVLGEGKENASPSHPQWSTIAREEHVFVKRIGEVD